MQARAVSRAVLMAAKAPARRMGGGHGHGGPKKTVRTLRSIPRIPGRCGSTACCTWLGYNCGNDGRRRGMSSGSSVSCCCCYDRLRLLNLSLALLIGSQLTLYPITTCSCPRSPPACRRMRQSATALSMPCGRSATLTTISPRTWCASGCRRTTRCV